MNRLLEFGAVLYLGIAVIYCLNACRGQRPAPGGWAGSLPPMPSQPGADEEITGRLALMGAMRADRGWYVTLPTARLRAGRVIFQPADVDKLERIAELLDAHEHWCVLIEVDNEICSAWSGNQDLPSTHANAVSRDLAGKGIDVARIQADVKGEHTSIGRVAVQKIQALHPRIRLLLLEDEEHGGPPGSARRQHGTSRI